MRPGGGGARLAGTALLVGAALLAACGSHPASQDTAAEPTLLLQDEPGWGPLITDPSGAPLYLDSRDRGGHPTCVDACTKDWIPLVVPDGASAQASVGVDGRLIGAVARPGGGRQITYGGWPLYIYLGDRTTFSVTGAGRHAAGGTFEPVTVRGRAARPRH